MHIPRLPGPITFLLVMVASLLLPLALVSSWTEATVTDTDQYVETVTPLASDPVVLKTVRKELRAVAIRAMAKTPAAGQQTATVDEAVRRVTADRRFHQAWAQGNRQVHEQVISVLEDDNPNVETGDGVLRINLGNLSDTLVVRLNEAGIKTPSDVSTGHTSIPLLKTSDLDKARSGYQLIDTLGFWLPVGWLILVGLLLLTARRRLATVGRLAIGSVVTLGVLAAGLGVGREFVTRQSPDRGLAEAVWDIVMHSLWTGLWSLMIAAGVVLAVRVLLGLVLGHRSTPAPN